jgi:hypothetical protein
MQRATVSRAFCRLDQLVSWEPTAMLLVTDPGPTRVGHFMQNLAPASTGAFFYARTGRRGARRAGTIVLRADLAPTNLSRLNWTPGRSRGPNDETKEAYGRTDHCDPQGTRS